MLASSKRQRADVGDDPLDPVDLPLGEVDADELDTGPQEPGEIRCLGERVADLEHPSRRDEAREHPGNLDHALVGSRRRLEPRQPLPPRPRAEPERDRVVELADAGRLGCGHELVEERRA